MRVKDYAKKYIEKGIKVMPLYSKNGKNLTIATIDFYKDDFPLSSFDSLGYIYNNKTTIKTNPTGLKIKCGSYIDEKGYLYCLDFDYDDNKLMEMNNMFFNIINYLGLGSFSTIEDLKREIIFEYTKSDKIHFFFFSKLEPNQIGNKKKIQYKIKEQNYKAEIELFYNGYINSTPTVIKGKKGGNDFVHTNFEYDYRMSNEEKTVLDCPTLSTVQTLKLIKFLDDNAQSQLDKKVKTNNIEILDAKTNINPIFHDKYNFIEEQLLKLPIETIKKIINEIGIEKIEVEKIKNDNELSMWDRNMGDKNTPNFSLKRLENRFNIKNHKDGSNRNLTKLIYEYVDNDKKSEELLKKYEIVIKYNFIKDSKKNINSLFGYSKLCDAYKRLKSYFYYDTNGMLPIRMAIAKFEFEVLKEFKNKKYKDFVLYIDKNNIDISITEKAYGDMSPIEIKMLLLSSEIKNNSLDKYIKELKLKKVIKKLDELDETKETLKKLDEIAEELKKTDMIEENLSKPKESIDQIDKDLENWKKFEELIKKLKEPKFITINSEEEKHEVSFNFIIDIPVELHILSTLWAMEFGKYLDNGFSKKSYGHRLAFSKKKYIANNFEVKQRYYFGGDKKLFKPYFLQYQNWRNEALKEVNHILEDDKENTILITLDIKKFFYNVNKVNLVKKCRDNKDDLYKNLKDEGIKEKSKMLNLCNIIDKINNEYYKKLKENLNDITEYIYRKENPTPLPIGLHSSMVLGNYALKAFDDLIERELGANFYGRYVDDVIIVMKFNDSNFKRLSKMTQEDLIKEILGNKILKKENEDYIFKIDDHSYSKKEDNEKCYDSFKVQKDKFKFYLFKKNDSKALLDNFVQNLKKNTSAFNLLPEEDELVNDFNLNALSIQYDGSPLKINSINDIQDDKYKLSIYLSKAISFNKYNNSKNNDEFGNQLVLFFKGKYLLKYSLLWEKLFTYLVTRKNSKDIDLIYTRILKEISKISGDIYLKDDIIEYLNNSFAMALSLDISIIKKLKIFSSFNKEENEIHMIEKLLRDKIKYLIDSNMIRHRYVYYPLVNYLKINPELEIKYFEETYENIKFKDKQLKIKNKKTTEMGSFELKCDPLKLEYSPRCIHLNEFIIHNFKKQLIEKEKDTNSSNNEVNSSYLAKASTDFYKYFYRNDKNKVEKNVKTFNFHSKLEDKTNIFLNKIISKDDNGKEIDEKKDKMRIGLASIKIRESFIEENLKKNQILSKEREQEINKILNEARKEKVDFLIFPELSIPFQWVNKIAEFSRNNGIAIIFGVEHLSLFKENSNKISTVYNFLATILPFNASNNYKTSYIKFRLKNHYSPNEKDEIQGRDHELFKISTNNNQNQNYGDYDLFYWKGLYFTVFNCFELTNISSRAKFHGYLDLLVASVYNRDIEYFNDILDSTSRDLHCFVAQSNTSQYGDSTIIQPKKSYKKDIIKIKGGDNSSLIVGTINIKELREHQIKNHTLQSQSISDFKPTPPGFTTQMAWNRINNKIKGE